MRIDLHVHTCFSLDSNLQLVDIVRAVAEGIIDGVAITDHNEIAGALALKRQAPFPVIAGEEIATREGEITGLFLSSRIEPGLSLKETIAAIRAQGGLVAVPHPFDRLRSAALRRDVLEQAAPVLDLVETFNARNIFSRDNHLADRFASQHALTKIAGSDAHSFRELGTAGLDMEPFDSPESFMAAARQAKIFAAKSPFSVHVAGKARKMLARSGRQRRL